MCRQGGELSAVGRTTMGALYPSHSPWIASHPHRSPAPQAHASATCEVVGDPAVPAVAAGLEAAVPRGQDVQVLLAQKGKAPAWKRGAVRQGQSQGRREAGHCLPAPKQSSFSCPWPSLQSGSSLLFPGPSSCLARE